MKKLFKKASIVALATLATVGLAACGETPTPTPTPDPDPKPEPDVKITGIEVASLPKNFVQTALFPTNGKINVIKSNGNKDSVTITPDMVQGFDTNTLGKKELTITYKGFTVKHGYEVIAPEKANGAHSYIAADFNERTKILGTLEKYAVEHNLTGIAVYEDGGYTIISDDVVRGSNKYIPNYGFGNISEGYIKNPMKNEPVESRKKYYHTFEVEAPGTMNPHNDKGSVVSELSGHITSGLFTTKMNKYKDGFEWAPALAEDERPVALNADANGLATKYRVHVKTTGVKYNTLSKDPKLAKFKDRELSIEDYIVPYVIHHTQAYGMQRAAENLEGSGALVGLAGYYNASKSGFNQEAWDKVGIKPHTENGKSYIDFEFILPTSRFYAMYYLAGGHSPVPADFVKELGNGSFAEGVKVWGNTTDSGLTPVDTTLSCGPFMVEKWDPQELVFMRNPNYVAVEGPNRYKMEGIHYKMLKAAKEDTEAGLREFNAGNLHSAGIPRTRLSEYINDPRAAKTDAGTTVKFNVNSCDEATWESLFGEKGSVFQTEKKDYYKVEPAMSNQNFIRALSYSINRSELCKAMGKDPSINFFGNSYQSNPEMGVTYNNTPEHKAAIQSLVDGADEYGYSLEKAKTLFKAAADELIAAGKYQKGDTISLEVVWQAQINIDVLGNDVEKYWKTAFDAANTGLKLEFKNIVPPDWQMAYFNYMMVGQFDLGFGGIEGNPLNPLNFFDTVMSDNRTGFTLNWGTDTSKVSEDIIYDGMYWSFNSLWEAAEMGGYFEEGSIVDPFTAAIRENGVVCNPDGTVTITIDVDMKQGVENLEVTFDHAVVCDVLANGKYSEDVIADKMGKAELSEDGKVLTLTLSKLAADKYKAGTGQNRGIDLFFSVNVTSIKTVQYLSLFYDFPKEA